MLVSQSKLKLSLILATKEAVVFAHFFGIYDSKRRTLESIEAGVRTINMINNDITLESAKAEYVEAVKVACQKLFTLNTAYYRVEGEYIIARLENFADMEKALEDVQRILYA